MRKTKMLGTALLFAGLYACSEQDPPTAAPPLSQVSLAAHLEAAQVNPREIEDDILALDAELGGVGGLYTDDGGALVIGITPGARRADIKSAVARRWSRNSPVLATESGRAREVRIVEMQHRFSDLVAYSQVALGALAGAKDMVSLDADERSNRVRVVVSKASARGDVMKRLTGAGVPAAMLEIDLGAPIHLMGNLKDKWRPTRGGIQIWSPVAQIHCSLGLNVTRVSDGQRYMLTASHCSNEFLGGTGLAIHQNNSTTANRVGEVAVNPQWWPGSYESCGSFTYCSYNDAMLVRYDEGIEAPAKISKTESMGTTTPGSIVVAGWWDAYIPEGFTAPTLGTAVDKVGRTSGWTRGNLLHTCQSIWTYQGAISLGVFCTNEVRTHADYGDSGGPVFMFPGFPYASTIRTPLGIVVGGNGLVGPDARMFYKGLQAIQFGTFHAVGAFTM